MSHLYRRADDEAHARAFLEKVFPRLAAWHEYLYRERDPGNEGLVYIRHPWESGMDNSPMWDEILLRMWLRPEEIPSYQRVDTHLVASQDRPASAAYDRFAWFVQLFAQRDYDEARIREDCPFLVQDVLFNTYLCQGAATWPGSPAPWEREQAKHLRQTTLELVREGGFYEYFHPITGEGHGSDFFSWTAALLLDLLLDETPKTGD